ncbi:helix-turn-helix domain-containing protein [Streptomyces monashensis]|uniref:helix-turn-helix domain-containing protein n=1 Tax=Streptomyces monashensis TaxID=1678012 RepID=UPI003F53F2F6
MTHILTERHDRTRDDDWRETSRRNARSVQTTVGWIFWNPGAVVRFEALGLPGPLGYIASRGAPLAPAGPELHGCGSDTSTPRKAAKADAARLAGMVRLSRRVGVSPSTARSPRSV